MRIILSAFVTVVLFGAHCFAAPACVEAPFVDYIRLGLSTGCTISNLLFTNFDSPSGTGIGDGIPEPTVTPVSNSSNPEAASLFFRFDSTFTTPNGFMEAFQYEVRSLTPQAQIARAMMTTTGLADGGGDVFISMFCTSEPAPTSPPCNTVNGNLLNEIVPFTPFQPYQDQHLATDMATFTPLSTLSIFFDVNVDTAFNTPPGGSATVTLTSISNSFVAVVPEPSTYMTFAAGVCVLLYRKRRGERARIDLQ